MRHYGLLGVLNTLLVFSYPGETDYDKKPYISFFVKFLICAYWAKKVIVLTIWFSMLVTVFTISLDFKIGISLLKCFLQELLTMLYVTILTSEIKFATYKIAAIKMYLFWRITAIFSQFFPCNVMSSYLYKVN